MGNPELSSYLSIISVWSMIQFEFVVHLNQRSVVLDGLQLLSMLTPLYSLLDYITLAAPSNADYPDLFQLELFIAKPSLGTYYQLLKHYSQSNH